MKAALTILTWMSAGAIASADILLDWPVDCVQGETCHIQNYQDHDATSGARDFTCGALSYDDHKGTDIALRTHSQMHEGVAVLAAAEGVVQGVRDGMADEIFTGGDLQGRDCGNGVVIDHGAGWVTQYCHMRRGSIVVGKGARITAGTKLGEIGLSGRTEFAHLHFSVRKDGEPVDPFTPNSTNVCGKTSNAALWAQDVRYVAGGLLSAGFSNGVPEYADVKAGTAQTGLSADSPLVLFGFAYGSKPGDVMRMIIEGPSGRVFSNDVEINRARAQLFRAGGKRAPTIGWPAGAYSGIVELLRDGKVISVLSTVGHID